MEREAKGPTKQQKVFSKERAIHKQKLKPFDKQDHPRSPEAKTLSKKNLPHRALLFCGFIFASIPNVAIVLILRCFVVLSAMWFSYKMVTIEKLRFQTEQKPK